MLKWLYLDIKRTLKSKKTYLLLTMLLFSMIYFVYNVNTTPMVEEVYISEEIEVDNVLQSLLLVVNQLNYNFDERCFLYESTEELQHSDFDYDKYCLSYETFLQYRQDLLNSYHENDVKTFLKTKMIIFDNLTDPFIENLNTYDDGLKQRILEKTFNIDLINQVKNDVKEKFSDRKEFKMKINYSNNAEFFNLWSKELYEAYNTYNNNYPIDIEFVVNPAFFVANYLDQYFIVLIFAFVMLIFDSYYRDYSSGVIKTLLSSPLNRFSYILLKLVSTIVSSVIIIILPLFIVSLYLYFKVGYFGFNYPVYISQYTTNTFKPYLEYAKFLTIEKPANYFSTYTKFCNLGPISKFPYDGMVSNNLSSLDTCFINLNYATIKIIMLSEYLKMILSYYILVTIFISLLNTLVSLIVNNRTYNLVILVSVLGLGLIFNQVLLGKEILKFLPTTFLSPTKLLMANLPYTYLNGLVTLSVTTIILFILSYILVKKKDFSF